jgi:hypothetical protein
MANNKRFDEDWDPSETFQTIMARIKQCREFAINAGQPYSEEQVLAKTHAIVFNTELYHNTLEKWEVVPISQATYDNFCKHMIQEQTRLQNKKTSKQHGYGMAADQIQELTENFLQHCHVRTAGQRKRPNSHQPNATRDGDNVIVDRATPNQSIATTQKTPTETICRSRKLLLDAWLCRHEESQQPKLPNQRTWAQGGGHT